MYIARPIRHVEVYGVRVQLPIIIDPKGTSTLLVQIAEQLRLLIEGGRLAPGSPVPTTRDLGKQLGVSRNTITSAYDALISQGYLYTEPAVGTFVSTTLPKALTLADTAGPETRSGSLYRALNLPLPYTGRGLPNLHRPASPNITVDFVFGRTAPRQFPEKVWRKIITDCLGGAAERMSEYNPPGGIPELRQLITSYLGPARGMVVSTEQVLIVGGFQQGIDLAAHLLVGTNTPIVMEAPTYRGAAFLFESYGGRILPVPVDQHGIDVGRLPTGRVNLVYVTPSHQFPTGVTMPLHRRLALLEWAAWAGAYVLEVDYDADFRYEGSPLPSLQSLDRNGCVIYLNSFSRTIGPGLRIGYIVVPRDLIRPALTIKALMDNGLPWLDQAALAQFIRDGSWESHLNRLRHAYQLRRDALLEALRMHVPGAAVSGIEGGTHLYVTLPASAPRAMQVQEACRTLGVGVYPLADSPAWLYEHLHDSDRSLVMGYTHLSEAQIRQGIELLGCAVTA
jgi:GntR family transcriptional regulator/MocR family aminotransferase